MKKRVGIILTLIVLLCVSAAVYCRISPSSDAWVAASELKKSTTFGFGPQGVAAHISDDEKRFFRILHSPKSYTVYRELYDTGTPAAKAYAIVGLEQTFFGRSDSRIEKFRSSTTAFLTLGSCIGRDCKPEELLSALEAGIFRQYIEHQH